MGIIKDEPCLLGKPDEGFGDGDECCCICANCYPAKVCNCFNQWPENLIFNISELNKKHGQIGWVCTALAFEGAMDIMPSNHGGCEMFKKRRGGKKEGNHESY